MVNYDFDRGVSVSTVRGKSSSSAGSHPKMGSSSDSPEYDVIGSTGGGGGAGGASGTADQSTKSRLIINEANPGDSGNYTCKPSNAVAASIQVFVSKNRGKEIHYFVFPYAIPWSLNN